MIENTVISFLVNIQKILTARGGIQKESFILVKPCITLRSETEGMETVEGGWNILLNFEDNHFIEKIINFNPRIKYNNIFGKNVAEKIREILFENSSKICKS